MTAWPGAVFVQRDLQVALQFNIPAVDVIGIGQESNHVDRETVFRQHTAPAKPSDRLFVQQAALRERRTSKGTVVGPEPIIAQDFVHVSDSLAYLPPGGIRRVTLQCLAVPRIPGLIGTSQPTVEVDVFRVVQGVGDDQVVGLLLELPHQIRRYVIAKVLGNVGNAVNLCLNIGCLLSVPVRHLCDDRLEKFRNRVEPLASIPRDSTSLTACEKIAYHLPIAIPLALFVVTLGLQGFAAPLAPHPFQEIVPAPRRGGDARGTMGFQVDARTLDGAEEQLGRVVEEVLVVRRIADEAQHVGGRSGPAAGTPGTLPIVGHAGRQVGQQDAGQVAEIHAHFERGGTGEDIDQSGCKSLLVGRSAFSWRSGPYAPRCARG